MTLTLTLPEVPMPKRFNPAADLIADALQTPTQQAAQRQAKEARAATAKQRAARKKLSPRETIAALTVGRTQAREARAYAEAWYQALRRWETVTRSDVVAGGGPPRSGGRMQPVVGNWGGAPGGVVTYTRVSTPFGWVSESALAARCNAEPLLGEVRRGAGLATLIHASGRGWAGERAREYGRSVLRLAVSLRDPRAESSLLLLSNAED